MFGLAQQQASTSAAVFPLSLWQEAEPIGVVGALGIGKMDRGGGNADKDIIAEIGSLRSTTIYVAQMGTQLERLIAYIRQRGGKSDLGHRLTVMESVIIDSGNTLGNVHSR